MLLKSLELHGFKTFPEKTKLTFETGITAVVGPNGSGKSNISDAMRWVLGEQSAKTLRCSKMEDVIFSGTPGRRGMSCAEVTLTIDNKDRKLNFDGDTVAVTRRFYRSGDSEYLINKASVRLKDIHELFMDTGLGRDGYSMIGQGKIDSIVAAKSEDRREIFEEAAGVSRFRYRKEEAERRLSRAEENLVRLRDILGELEGRVEPLRQQAEKAEQFLVYSKEKKDLEIRVSLAALEKSGAALREQEHKIDAAQAEFDAAGARMEALSREAESAFAKTNALTVSMDELRSAAAADEAEATRCEGEARVLQGTIEHHLDTIRRIKEDLDQSRLSDEDMQRQIDEKNEAVRQKNEEYEKLNADFMALSGRVEELRRQLDAGSEDTQSLTSAVAAEQAALAEIRIQASAARTSMDEIERRSGEIDTAVSAAKEKAAELEKTSAELLAMAEDLQKQLTAAENSLNGQKQLLDHRREKQQNQQRALDELRLDIGGMNRRISMLEEMEKSLEGFHQSVKTVLREANRGALRGIHGPVSKLITVPGEYALAIETALGAAMQNIVVDGEAEAKAAIRLLKQRDAGRATFLPLTTIRGSEIQEPGLDQIPGLVGVASRVCSCDEKYRSVLQSLLGRVLLAEDLDAAGTIARQFKYRWRVVTLDGQVVNAGGSFTGGSSARSAGILSRAAEIVRLRKQRQDMHERSEKATAQLKTLQEETAALEAQREVDLAACNECREELRRVQEEIRRTRFEIESNTNVLQNLEQEKREAAGRIQRLSEEAAAAEEKIQACRERIQRVEEQLSAAGDTQRELAEKSDSMAARLQELRLACFAAATEKESMANAVEELQRRRREGAARTESLHREIDSLEQQNTQLGQQAQQQNQQAESLRVQAQEKQQKIQALAEERTQSEQRSAALRAEERTVSSQKENAGGALARLQERRDTLQKEYDTVIARLWEEYELTRREAEQIAAPAEDLPKAQRRLTELRGKIRALGSVNVAAVEEYKEVSERYTFLKEQIEDAETSKTELLQLITRLTRQMKEVFVERFGEIRTQFTQIFKDLFGGGNADITIADENDVLNSGIEITVHPPGKIVTHIEALSGGEKALVAIAIYFAIMRVSPPPFCMLDEIEAALDDVNVARFASYLRRMSGNTQFIAITHRRGTMEEADVLYGVTMQDQGISQLLELHPDEIDAHTAAQ